MRYTIEDTPTGFRFSIVTPRTGGTLRSYDEPGSHGPLAELYAHAERVRDAVDGGGDE